MLMIALQVRNKLEILDSDNLDSNLGLLEQFYTEKDADYPEIVSQLLYFDYTNKKKEKISSHLSA